MGLAVSTQKRLLCVELKGEDNSVTFQAFLIFGISLRERRNKVISKQIGYPHSDWVYSIKNILFSLPIKLQKTVALLRVWRT